jgi:hypothetical protein
MEKSSLLAFTANQSAAVPVSGNLRIAVTRQASYPVWVDQTVPNAAYAFWTIGSQSSATPLISRTDLGIPDSTRSNVVLPATTTRIGTTGPVSANGYQNPIMGWLGNDLYFYLPAGNATFAVAINSPFSNQFTLDGDMALVIRVFDTPTNIETYEYAAAINANDTYVAIPIVLGRAAWINISSFNVQSYINALDVPVTVALATPYCGSVTWSQTGSNMLSFTFTQNASVALLPTMIGTTEFTETNMPWRSTRVTALSLLATNVTNIQNKGGTILASRVNPKVNNLWNFSESDVNAVHPSERAYLALETGFYTYVPPSGDMMNFADYTVTTLTSQSAPAYRLDNDALNHIAFFRSAGSVESLALTVDIHLEFRNTLALFQVGMSTLTLESLHQAQLELVKKGFL